MESHQIIELKDKKKTPPPCVPSLVGGIHFAVASPPSSVVTLSFLVTRPLRNLSYTRWPFLCDWSFLLLEKFEFDARSPVRILATWCPVVQAITAVTHDTQNAEYGSDLTMRLN